MQSVSLINKDIDSKYTASLGPELNQELPILEADTRSMSRGLSPPSYY